MRISFFVGGLPKSMNVGGVARFKRGTTVHLVPKRRNSEWALLVGQIGRAHAPAVPLEGPLALTALFYMPRPKSGRKALAPIKRPDVDNLIHKLTDNFNGVLWQDDAQVVELLVRNRFAEDGRAGVEITVEAIVPRAAGEGGGNG